MQLNASLKLISKHVISCVFGSSTLVRSGTMTRDIRWNLTRLSAWSAAVPLAVLIRFDGEWLSFTPGATLTYILFATITDFLISYGFSRLPGNFEDELLPKLLRIVACVGATALVLLLVRVVSDYPLVPRSVPLLASIIAVLIQFAVAAIENGGTGDMNRRQFATNRVIIYGAGAIGKQLAEQILDFREIYTLMCFIDDDPQKIGTKLLGVRVMGPIQALRKAVSLYSPNLLLVAISDLNSAKMDLLNNSAKTLNVEVKYIPNLDDLVSGTVQISDLQPLSEEKLLGRPQALHENEKVIALLSKSRVLVTGAAGSIGSEIVRQLHKYATKEVYLLDRDESGLLRTKLNVDLESDLTDESILLGDIRDFEHLSDLLKKIKPDIVFHAAALKHVSTLERFPEEARKTNFEGTLNLWKASLNENVKYFVNISSDKAADPTTELGKSKLLAERIIASTPKSSAMEKYISVRFGNVIGSNGSFVEVFKKQIEKGGPVTVRHPDVTRYFMTVAEAVQLVFEGLIVGSHGETLILDMGRPIKILDVANQMIRASGRNIQIVFTGLSPGEKLHEDLVGQVEKTEIRDHPRIMHTRVEAIDISKVQL